MRDGDGDGFELIVLGGGMTGLALAAAVGSVGGRVLVVERSGYQQLLSAPHDGRVTAVAQGSKRFLAAIGAWSDMADGAEPILDIVVREGFSPIEVHYDHRAAGAEPLGYIVENHRVGRLPGDVSFRLRGRVYHFPFATTLLLSLFALLLYRLL